MREREGPSLVLVIMVRMFVLLSIRAPPPTFKGNKRSLPYQLAHRPYIRYAREFPTPLDQRLVPLLLNNIRIFNYERGDMPRTSKVCGPYNEGNCTLIAEKDTCTTPRCKPEGDEGAGYYHICRWCKRTLMTYYQHPQKSCPLARLFGDEWM